MHALVYSFFVKGGFRVNEFVLSQYRYYEDQNHRGEIG